MIGYNNIYLVYRLNPHEEELHPFLVAKFVLTEHSFDVLEDHTGLFKNVEKESPEKITKFLRALNNSMYFNVVNLEDMRQGQHPDLIPEYKVPQVKPESIFEYHRVGMAKPQTLEFVAGKPYLDGHALSEEELKLIFDNIRESKASLQYKEDKVTKTEDLFMELAKVEPALEHALAQLRQSVREGHLHPDVLRTLSKEIFTDSMVNSMGNKKSYADFLSRPKKGVHVALDMNRFGQVNKRAGFETGNEAIKASGNAIREALDESVGRHKSKSWRVGGDEFRVHVPTHEDAAHFSRVLRSKLETIPHVGGFHKLSASIGIGQTPEEADKASIHAKGHFNASSYPEGQEKTHVHSLVPGVEGQIE